MRHSFTMRTGVVALFVCCFPAALVTQAPTDSAHLAGTVRSVLNGELLAGVLVALPGLQKFIVTDSTGVFTFTTPPGTHHLRVRYQDHVNEDYDLVMRAGQHTHLEILLDVAAIHLAPVVVEGRPSIGSFGIVGFYARRRFGFGRFVTAEQLSRDGSQSLADYLSRFGLRYGCVGMTCGPIRYTAGAPCLVPMMLDGVPEAGRDVLTLQTHELGGIEIYRDPSSVPVSFAMALSVDPANSQRCGALVVWTKVWELGRTDSTGTRR
jgi:hypothetical protein